MFNKATLKRKIQGSMFKTACITLLISLMLILPMIYIAIIPITAFISESVNDSIMQNYVMNFDAEMKSMRKWQNENQIDELSVDDLVDLLHKTNNKSGFAEDNIMKEMIQSQDEQSIFIDSLDESSQKRFILSMLTVLYEIEEFIPLKDYSDIDAILTEFRANGELTFVIPEDFEAGSSRGISYFEEMHLDSETHSIINKKLLDIYNDSKSILTIYDENTNVIGTITTAVNPLFIFFVMVPIIIAFVISGFIALIIAVLMSKLLSIPILKPINLLNQQLSAIVKDDYTFTRDMYIVLRRPPKEIKDLRDNTNRIMKKMKSYYDDLEDYKDELEAQNTELEAKNIELADSKQLIENQQDQLVQSEKMASIGQLSAAIAHEINTPLGAIKSNCQMTETILPLIESALSDIDNQKMQKSIKNLKNSNAISLEASKQMIEIIRNLKNFSRLDQSDYQEADINEGIRSVLVLTSNLWKNKVEIIEEFSVLPPIVCYPGMLNQVFMNILVNAIQASEQNGVVNIRTTHNEEFILVEIEDHGMGIPENEINRIFDSGFTTKKKDNGTGLGLSISKDIIDRHKGSISVTSILDKGTKFTVKLPIKHEFD